MKLLYYLFAPNPEFVLGGQVVFMVMSIVDNNPLLFMFAGIVSVFCVKAIVEGRVEKSSS